MLLGHFFFDENGLIGLVGTAKPTSVSPNINNIELILAVVVTYQIPVGEEIGTLTADSTRRCHTQTMTATSPQ